MGESKINKILTEKTEYITFDEASAEHLIEDLKQESFAEGFILTNYSIQKKNKKEVEYFIIKATKQFNDVKEIVDGGK
jgi:nucleoid-associated protein YejK